MSRTLGRQAALRGETREVSAHARGGRGYGEEAAAITCSRLAVWREVLRTRWVGLAAVLSLIGALHLVVGWDVPGLGRIVHGDVWLILLLFALLIAALEGSHRAVARRQQELEVRRQQVERLIAAGRPFPGSGGERPS